MNPLPSAAGEACDPRRVTVVGVSWESASVLPGCLESLAAQSLAPEAIVVVDNASTDGTEEAVAASGVEVAYVRLARNGGGAEGFHYGVKHALAAAEDGAAAPADGGADPRGAGADGATWLWLMDDDCEPLPECLERLLASRAAADPGTSVVCPTVVSGQDALLPLNRLKRARRFVRSPLVPAAYDADEERIDTASFVGPLIRSGAARTAGLPERRVFIRFDDIEYIDRLGKLGQVVNVAAATIRHKEPVPLDDVSLRGTQRLYLTRRPFSGQWKHLYGIRNLIWAGRRHGWMTRANALGLAAQNVGLFLVLGERRLRLARLAALYAADGLRGRFRNVAPGDWDGLADAASVRGYLAAHALRYEAETDGPTQDQR